MLRIAALTALVFGLVTISRGEAQDAPLAERTVSQNLEAHVAQMEIQVKLSKLKKLFEEIAKQELELATLVVEVDDQNRPFFSKTENLIDSLRSEVTTTREQLEKLASVLPQGYPLQPHSSLNQLPSPEEAVQKLHSHSLKSRTANQEAAPQVLAVKVEFTKVQLIADLLWGVLRADDRQSVGADERANLIILRGDKQWMENARKLIETLDRSGAPNLKGAEKR